MRSRFLYREKQSQQLKNYNHENHYHSSFHRFIFFCKAQINIIKINCPDSLGFKINQGFSQACEFYFENENPDLFYVEDFSHKDFYNLIYKGDNSKIRRVKLVSSNYIPAIHDFVFAYNKNNTFLFYYIP